MLQVSCGFVWYSEGSCIRPRGLRGSTVKALSNGKRFLKIHVEEPSAQMLSRVASRSISRSVLDTCRMADDFHYAR